MSLAFAVSGFAVGAWAFKETKNWSLLLGIWYFCAMELLQFFQYFWLDDCAHPMNQFLTVIGFLHIAFQPYFTHLLGGAFITKPSKVAKMTAVRHLSLVAGVFMFSRYLMATPAHHIKQCDNVDWLRGERTCTFTGNYHLAWELPMYDATYFMPSNFIHFFMMFAPYIIMGPEMWLHGLILFATGPLLSSYITPNLYEQASIWCFFSIGQVTLATLMLRRGLNHPKVNKWKAEDRKSLEQQHQTKTPKVALDSKKSA